MRGWGWMWIVLLALSLGAVGVQAADTGTISGLVVDRDGEPVADATVTIAGDQLPSGRSVVSGANGLYQFEYVIPGEYTIQIEKAGMPPIRRAAVVEVGRNTAVDVVLGLTIQEALTVTAIEPVVDVRSTEVSFNFKSDTLNSLPLDRTYRGLFQLIPGVADNRSPVGPAAGGSRQDNTYLIDGANITNPGFGYLSTEVNELDIAEVNLKRAAISAEFGRTAGSVTNAVSRAGSNQFAGIGRIDWLPSAFVGAYKLPSELSNAGVKPGTFRDPLLTSDLSPAVGVGGPLVRDRVFFYGSARYFRETKWDRVNKVGSALPDEVRTGHELYGKLTASPTSKHQLTASYRYRPNRVDNSGLTSDFAPSVATTSDNGSRIATLEWAHFMTGRRSAERALPVHEGEQRRRAGDRASGCCRHSIPTTWRRWASTPIRTRRTSSRVAASTATRRTIGGTNCAVSTVSSSTSAPRSHVVKAGGGYELGEEVFNRARQRLGRDRQHSRRTAFRRCARATTRRSRRRSDRAHLLAVRAGRRDDREADDGERGRSAESRRVLAERGGQRRMSCDGDAERRRGRLRVARRHLPLPAVRIRRRNPAASGRQLSAARGQERQGVRELGPLLQHGSEIERPQSGADPHLPDADGVRSERRDPVERSARLDDRQDDRSRDQADLHRRDRGRLRDAVRGAYSLDVFFMSRGMHNFIEDVPSRHERHGARQRTVRGVEPAVRRVCRVSVGGRAADLPAFTIDLTRRRSGKWMGDVSYTWSRFEGNFDLDYSPATQRRGLQHVVVHPGRTRDERRGSESVRSAVRGSAARVQGVRARTP